VGHDGARGSREEPRGQERQEAGQLRPRRAERGFRRAVRGRAQGLERGRRARERERRRDRAGPPDRRLRSAHPDHAGLGAEEPRPQDRPRDAVPRRRRCGGRLGGVQWRSGSGGSTAARFSAPVLCWSVMAGAR
jgi:hypothetical protein